MDDGRCLAVKVVQSTSSAYVKSQVGAAISMTYITGQPIVFVGTGQTYRDLRSLNVQAVISVLLK